MKVNGSANEVSTGVTRFMFKQVDVFTATPFLGNPVAVVFGADTLSGNNMQQIASWTNLSETTFVTSARSGGDYRVRFFSPGGELDFAGHPSIGTAHALLEAGIIDADRRTLVQECNVGDVQLFVEESKSGRRIFVAVPEPAYNELDRAVRERVISTLRLSDADLVALGKVKVGPTWLVAQLKDGATVQGAVPDLEELARLSRELQAYGLTIYSLTGSSDPAADVRSFAPAHGVTEDPVCGSGNAAVASLLWHSGAVATVGESYVASQGEAVGRKGRVHVRISNGGQDIEVGGHSVTVIDGYLSLLPTTQSAV